MGGYACAIRQVDYLVDIVFLSWPGLCRLSWLVTSVFNKATQLKIRENHLWFDLLQFCRNISHLISNTELK